MYTHSIFTQWDLCKSMSQSYYSFCISVYCVTLSYQLPPFVLLSLPPPHRPHHSQHCLPSIHSPFHSSVPHPLFLSFLFRPADWCLFLSSISVLPLVHPPTCTPSPTPPSQGSCSNSALLHQPSFLLLLIGLYSLSVCKDVKTVSLLPPPVLHLPIDL